MSAPAFTLIRNGLVVDPVARKAERADILVEGDSIAAVGPPGLDAPEGADMVEAGGFIIHPGLINAHTHTHHALGKGRGDRWSLDILLTANPWLAGGLTLEDKALCARLNAAEMVLKGCTAAYDMFFELPVPSREGMDAVAQGYSDVGVRCVIAPMMADISYYKAIPGLLDAFPEAQRTEVEKIAAAPFERQVEACRAIFAGWSHPREQVRPALGPTIPLHCTDGFLSACGALAEEFDTGIQIHLAEAKFQAASALKAYGRSLAAHLDGLGLVGPRFSGAHCVWLDGDDIALMAGKGAMVAHNPGSNLRLGSGIAPARAMRDAGLCVGIGTDGSSCSDSQNMYEAMRTASFVSRIMSADYADWLSTWDILEMATAGSARVLGLDSITGRIAPGYRADLVFLDASSINFVPLNDAANQIVNAEDSSAVHSVMIDGRMVLEARRFTSFDYEALRREAQTAADRMTVDNAAARHQAEALEPFVAKHCIGLASEAFHIRRRIEQPF